MVAVVAGRSIDEKRIAAMVDEANELLTEMDQHREKLAEVRERRKAIVRQLADELGRAETARRLGITRQAVTNLLNS